MTLDNEPADLARLETSIYNNWLVTGGTGFLGSNLVRKLRENGIEVCSTSRTGSKSKNHIVTDLLDTKEIRQLLEHIRPSVVIHAAALASVEQCEADKELAIAVNVSATAELRNLCEVSNIPFVFISSDAVFDGKTGDYSETSPTNPVNYYGETKVLAEELILRSGYSKAIISRVNFFGWSQPGQQTLAEYFIEGFENQIPVAGFTDAIFSPLYVDHLSNAIVDLVAAKFGGVVHVVGSEPISKFDFGRLIARLIGANDSLLIGKLSEAVLQVPRGKNLSLSTKLISSVLGYEMPNVESGVLAMLNSPQRKHLSNIRRS